MNDTNNDIKVRNLGDARRATLVLATWTWDWCGTGGASYDGFCEYLVTTQANVKELDCAPQFRRYLISVGQEVADYDAVFAALPFGDGAFPRR